MHIYDVCYVGSKSRIFLQLYYNILYVCAGDVCLQTLHETSLRYFDFAGYQITTERLSFRRFQVVYLYYAF